MLIHTTEIIKYHERDFSHVAVVYGKSMADNPMHKAVFTGNIESSINKQILMFSRILKNPKCNIYVASYNGEIVGSMNYYLPDECQLTFSETLKLLPGLITDLGADIVKLLAWKKIWDKYDPKERHVHFGPFAVLPEWQNKGLGSILLSKFCQFVDKEDYHAYLETDKEQNLHIYRKFGFEVINEASIFGVKSWFMWRPRKSTAITL